MSPQLSDAPAGLAIRVAILAMLSIAVYRAVLVAWADLIFRQSTPVDIEKAERLVPANALYRYTHALLIEQTDPLSPEIEREFAAATAINPRYSDALMAWSVQREMHHDVAGSEQLLLQAQRLDHTLRPAWALANYYYRQGNTDAFLAQARETLRIIGVSEISEGRFSINPIFDLCWKSGAGAEAISSKAIPDIPAILGGYLNYVLHTGHPDSGPAIVARMMPTAEPGEMFFLRPYLDDLLARNQVGLAAQTWKQLYEKHILPYRGPDINQGVFLTNGSIAGPPLDYGFDWRRVQPESVQFTYSRLEHSYRFDFDGSEPEQFELLVQILPLKPSRTYSFESVFQTDLRPEQSGLLWSIHDHKTRQELKGKHFIKDNGESQTLVMTFDTSAPMDSADLTLSYRREPGTALLHGYYQLSHADLQLR